jgi:hypothetical protein
VSHERGQPAACPPYANIPRTASRQAADLSSTLRARPPRLARAARGPRTAAAPRARRSSLFTTRPAGRRTRETIHAAACRKADPRRTPPRGTRRALTRAGVVPRRGCFSFICLEGIFVAQRGTWVRDGRWIPNEASLPLATAPGLPRTSSSEAQSQRLLLHPYSIDRGVLLHRQTDPPFYSNKQSVNEKHTRCIPPVTTYTSAYATRI